MNLKWKSFSESTIQCIQSLYAKLNDVQYTLNSRQIETENQKAIIKKKVKELSSSLLTASCLAHAHQLHAPCAIVTFLKQQTRATYCYYSLAFLLLTKWFMLSLPSRLSMVHIEDVVYNCFATLSDADIVCVFSFFIYAHGFFFTLIL